MAKFLRRMNRGIALGAAALVALVIFLSVDAAAFGKNRDEIKDMLDEFAKVHSEINVLPEQYLRKDFTMPSDAEVNQIVSERLNIARKYIKENDGNYMNTMQNISDIIRNQLQFHNETGFVLKYDMTVASTKKISSKGPGYAGIEEAVFDITVEYVGTPVAFTVQSSDHFAYSFEYIDRAHYKQYGEAVVKDEYQEQVEPDTTTIWRSTFRMSYYNLLLVKADGVWKLSPDYRTYYNSMSNGEPEKIGTL